MAHDLTSRKKGLLAPGQVLSGRYRVRSLLAYGASSEVYLVQDNLLNGQLLALKLFDRSVCKDPRILSALQQELLINRTLRHPNILHIYDASFGEFTHDYITIEFVEGCSLVEMLRSNQTDELSLEEAVYVFVEFAAGLSYAHQQSVFHRDISPEQVLISTRGDVRIQRCGRPQVLGRKLTHSKEALFELESPEQKRDGIIDENANQYSLGLLLFGLLAGLNALKNLPEAELLSDIRSLRATPRWVAQLIQTCTQVNPEKRFDSMEQALLFVEAQSDIDAIEEVARERLKKRILESRRVVRQKRSSTIGKRRQSARSVARVPKKLGD